jgi:hypothetical protein
MNSTGFLRGYMAKNMSSESFINIVVKAISIEFNEHVQILNTSQDEYEIMLKNYKLTINSAVIDELRTKSPYALDRFLLSEFKAQGFDFHEERSQYMKYCFDRI